MAVQPAGGPEEFAIPDALPVLPLRDAIVFPLTAVPLAVAEPRADARPWYEAEEESGETVELTEVFDAAEESAPVSGELETVDIPEVEEGLAEPFPEVLFEPSEALPTSPEELPAEVAAPDLAAEAGAETFADAAIAEVCASGAFVHGPACAKFESTCQVN